MRAKRALLILALILAFIIAAACGDDETTEAESIGPNNDDDDDNDDDDSTGDMYSDDCGIQYGVDPGCDDSDYGCLMVPLLNEDRYNNPEESDCAPALYWNEELAAVALAHSIDMCERDFFDHSNPDGDDPFDRMDDADIGWIAAGENIFWGSGMSVSAALGMAEDGFMDEPECTLNHRSNILNRNFTHVGIGVYECPNGKIFITQDFASFSYDDIRNDPHEYCPNFS